VYSNIICIFVPQEPAKLLLQCVTQINDNKMEVLDIRQLIGEATEYDKKLALEVKRPKSWCKSVSAFANGIGGKLIWGIADDDALIGVADAKGDAEKISEAINHILTLYRISICRLPNAKIKNSWY
jgi:predicted HTH transcriptional regulator